MSRCGAFGFTPSAPRQLATGEGYGVARPLAIGEGYEVAAPSLSAPQPLASSG